MNSTLKLWTQLGLGTALAGAALAACSGEAERKADTATADHAALASGVAGREGEAGAAAGGEGEGGVAVADAARDPIAYGIALAVTEAHVIAARDAFMAGRREAAAEMFAHPAAEVLVAMDPVFAARGVKDFKPLLIDAADAVFSGKDAAEINQRYEAIIAALRDAAAKAPDDGSDAAKVAMAIIADQIERASLLYRKSNKDERDEPYLDGYGFARVAEATFARSGAAIKAANPAAHARIAEALALLKQAYPSATRPARLAIEPGAVSAASARVMLAITS